MLSKLGFCSRSEAGRLIKAQRVRVNGRLCCDPEAGVDIERDRLEVDGQTVVSAAKVYMMLNKPRGLVTTRSDEHGRQTVYSCLPVENISWLSPVGRLDRASEGLILFTNDTAWADRILAPESRLDKTYHVHVNRLADAFLLQRLTNGVAAQDGEFLSAKRAQVVRHGEKNTWLEIVLDEGKNRHIRRLLEACGLEVLRLIRIAVGPLVLGSLPKGQCRSLTKQELRAMAAMIGSD